MYKKTLTYFKINIMKNIKDITLSIFAVIGFVALLSSFTQEVVYTEKQISNGTPESHVWEVYGAEGNYGYLLNKVTGEVVGLNAQRNAKMILKTIDTR